MDCGLELQAPNLAVLEDLLSYIGFGGKEEEKGTPSTVGLEQDEKTTDAAILAVSKKLTYGTSSAPRCGSRSSGNGSPQKKSPAESRCTPENCRMSSGMCVDCEKCHECCTCDENTVDLLQKVVADTDSEQISPHRSSAQPKQGLHAGNPKCTSVEQSAPRNQVQNQSGGNSLRYNMGDEGEYLHLTHRMLKEHTNRSRRTDSSSHHSYGSYNSSNTGSSRRRYNFGDENDLDYNYNQKRTTRRSHRRTASNGSNNSSSWKSNTSFSLRLGKKKNSVNQSQHVSWSSSSSNKVMDDAIIGKTFSFDSNASRGSAFGSAHSSNHTRRSTSTRRKTSSQGGSCRSSLSSSSRSYLEDGVVIETDSKKSWFRRRFESKE